MFLKLNLAISSDDNNEEQVGLKYKLSPHPMYLFDDHGFMRSTIKADLATHLIIDSNCVTK